MEPSREIIPPESKKKRRLWPWFAAVFLVALAAASTVGFLMDDQPAKPAAVAAPSPIPEEPTPTPTPAPTDRTADLGQTVALSWGTATVYRYKANGRIDKGPTGAVDIKVCNRTNEAIGVSARPWALLFADDTVSDATVVWSGSGAAQPEYPDKKLVAGRCARGWITYELSGGQKPVAVEYQPDGGPIVTWTVR